MMSTLPLFILNFKINSLSWIPKVKCIDAGIYRGSEIHDTLHRNKNCPPFSILLALSVNILFCEILQERIGSACLYVYVCVFICIHLCACFFVSKCSCTCCLSHACVVCLSRLCVLHPFVRFFVLFCFVWLYVCFLCFSVFVCLFVCMFVCNVFQTCLRWIIFWKELILLLLTKVSRT
jgi:nuclear pore complex protein Nup62